MTRVELKSAINELRLTSSTLEDVEHFNKLLEDLINEEYLLDPNKL